ncbi:MAG: carboxypeptidase regulatory-like domain-containing protein [Planctomycetota bacterium]|nr:carboxypeptidase regulatory-like domain-containing protein [Planctomycetota bacterium]
MGKRIVVIIGLLVAAGLAWWVIGDTRDAAIDRQGPDRVDDSATEAALEGRAATDTADTTPSESAEPEASSVVHRFVVHVRMREAGTPSAFGGPDWKENDGDEKTSSPFAGQRVRLVLERGGVRTELARAVLDDRGELVQALPALGRLSPLARAASRLYALPEGTTRRLAPRSTYADMMRNAYGTGWVDLPARPAGDPTVLRLIVPVMGTELVTGRVLDARGDPIPDAHVWPSSGDGGRSTEACTDDEGRFAFEVLKAGTFNVWYEVKDGRAHHLEDVALAPERAIDLGDLVLEDAEAFAGRVTYPDGTPVVGLPITASYFLRNMHVSYGPPSVACDVYGSGRATRTDAKGWFRIHPGYVNENTLWTLRADFEGNARFEEAQHALDKTRADLHGVMHGHRVRIRITDAEGSAVGDARVILRAAVSEEGKKPKTVEVDTRRDGTADVWLVRDSGWDVQVIAEGGEPAHAQLRVPSATNESDFDITVQPLSLDAGIRIALTDPDGSSLFPVVLTVRTAEGASIWNRRVEASGFFLALAPGTYTVAMRSIERATWAGGRARWLRHKAEVTVAAGQVVDVRAQVSQAAHAEVTLRVAAGIDPKKGPMPHISSVWFENEETGWRYEALIGPMYAGSKTEVPYADFEPGSYLVKVVERGFKTVTKRVELREAELTKIEFILEPE